MRNPDHSSMEMKLRLKKYLEFHVAARQFFLNNLFLSTLSFYLYIFIFISSLLGKNKFLLFPVKSFKSRGTMKVANFANKACGSFDLMIGITRILIHGGDKRHNFSIELFVVQHSD